MNTKIRSKIMPKTEKFIQDFVASGRTGDVAIAIGDGEGEVYRFFCSARGDVLNGQTVYDMMSVSKIMATTPLFYMAMEEGLVSPEDTLGKHLPTAYDNPVLPNRLVHLGYILSLDKNQPFLT